MNKHATAGLILAAGMSTRMGQPKQLITIDGRSIVERVTEAALASRLDSVVLILGHQAEDIIKHLGDMCSHPKLLIVTNEDFEAGMSTSIHLGLSHIRDKYNSVMILLGDLPLLSCSIIDTILDAFHISDKPICLPIRNGQKGHPVCLGKLFFNDLMTLEGDLGARNIILNNKDAVNLVEVDEDGCYFDIDTPQDLVQFRKYFNA